MGSAMRRSTSEGRNEPLWHHWFEPNGETQQNSHIERYNRTIRHVWLDQYSIKSIEEA